MDKVKEIREALQPTTIMDQSLERLPANAFVSGGVFHQSQPLRLQEFNPGKIQLELYDISPKFEFKNPDEDKWREVFDGSPVRGAAIRIRMHQTILWEGTVEIAAKEESPVCGHCGTVQAPAIMERMVLRTK
jgi:hypothetical protein